VALSSLFKMKGALRFNFLSCLIFMFIIQIIIGFAFEQTTELMVGPNTNKMFSSSSLDGKHLIITGLEVNRPDNSNKIYLLS